MAGTVAAMRRPRLRPSEITQTRLRMGMVPAFTDWQQAFARSSVVQVPTVCNGCEHRCGVVAHVKSGRLWRLTGNARHAENQGAVCAYALDYAARLYHPSRLTLPYRRADGGALTPTAWPQALNEIASRLRTLVATHGPDAVAFLARPNPTAEFYGRRLMAAFGSPNYTVTPNHLMARDVAYHLTFGFVPVADLARTRLAVFMGRSGLNPYGPHTVHGLEQARRAGARVVVVDPVGPPGPNGDDEWVPIRPGTDLALLLAWAHVLIRDGLYDTEFVQSNAEGFGKFAAAVADYTPHWAEAITSVPANTILRLAHALGRAKPAAVIYPSRSGEAACYANCLDTMRAQAAVNVLLGSPGRAGGLFPSGDPGFGDLPTGRFPPPSPVGRPRLDGAGDRAGFPLAATAAGVPSRLLELAAAGRVKGLILYRVNPFRIPGNWNINALRENTDLIVAIDVHMPPWAETLADFLLPECHYLERDEAVEAVPAHPCQVALCQKAVEPISSESRALDEIVTWLVRPTGWGRYFSFSLPDLNWARLAPFLVSCAQLHEAGAMDLSDEPRPPLEFLTVSGKAELAGRNWTAHGAGTAPQWQPPGAVSAPAQFRPLRIHLPPDPISGPGKTRRSTQDVVGVPVWINPIRAEQLGLSAGDTALLRTPRQDLVVRVEVTAQIHPEALLLPPPVWDSCSDMIPAQACHNAGLYGQDTDPLLGTPLTHEVSVTLERLS